MVNTHYSAKRLSTSLFIEQSVVVCHIQIISSPVKAGMDCQLLVYWAQEEVGTGIYKLRTRTKTTISMIKMTTAF